MTTKNSSENQFINSLKQGRSVLRPQTEKVEISREEIINTLKTIESLKRKWLSYLK